MKSSCSTFVEVSTSLLNAVGSVVWKALVEGASTADAVDAVVAAFDITADVALASTSHDPRRTTARSWPSRRRGRRPVTSLSTCAMHLIARLAVRSARPARASAIVAAAGRFTPRLNEDTARDALHALDGRGTCLTRALAVAARLDGGQIAIGVRYASGSALRAHAWVVSNGVPLRAGDPDGDIIALLDPTTASAGWGNRLQTHRVRFA